MIWWSMASIGWNAMLILCVSLCRLRLLERCGTGVISGRSVFVGKLMKLSSSGLFLMPVFGIVVVCDLFENRGTPTMHSCVNSYKRERESILSENAMNSIPFVRYDLT